MCSMEQECFAQRATHTLLGKAQGFLICPGQVTYYEADADTPWAYAWVGFHGMRAQHYLKLACLDESNPIFTTLDHDATSELLKQMVKSCTLTRSREICLRGYLYQFLAHLVEAAPDRSNRRAKAEPSCMFRKP